MRPRNALLLFNVLVLAGVIPGYLLTAVADSPGSASRAKKPSTKTAKSAAKKAAPKKAVKKKTVKKSYDPWTEPSYADSTAGDRTEGEDLTVRAAAVKALNGLNGSVVVVDPNTGRVLTMVNQQLALHSGFQPCSTIKLTAGMAALSEGLIERDTRVRLGGNSSMDLTRALAVSNNPYFANLGVKLGFDRVSYYARLFGYGEKAGLNIEGEEPGILPATPPANGGVGMMTSFGEGITQTPLQLAALLSAMANGGKLYYMQYPRSDDEARRFVPRIKRYLDIGRWSDEMKPGMMGAVEFGTARRAAYNPNEPIMGKTGTCTDRRSPGTHLGWFGSFNEVGDTKLVVVVMLTGGRAVNGPVASGVAGQVFKNLSEHDYFAKRRTVSPLALISVGSCCAAR